jgi:pyrroline-5-carboxylate reductase
MSSAAQYAAGQIAFIGGGNMARALIAGLLRRDVPARQLRVGEPVDATRDALARDFGIEVAADNRAAVRDAQLIVLAVKPQEASTVLRALRATLPEPLPVLLSIAAGVRIADLARLCPTGMPIVRAMPNRPALVGAGVTGLYAAPGLSAAQHRMVEAVAASAGRTVWLRSESELDIVTALSGSGPAYFFLLAEHLARSACALGLDAQTASLLAVETLHGTGQLARDGGALAQQRAAVTSRGGTTEAALRVFEAGGFEALVARALAAAATRSVELATLIEQQIRESI